MVFALVPLPVQSQELKLVYPHSLIPGGITSTADYEAHRPYGADVGFLRPTYLQHDLAAFVDYRDGNSIRWTKTPVTLKKGELVFADRYGHMVRGRCGNDISFNAPTKTWTQHPSFDLDTPMTGWETSRELTRDKSLEPAFPEEEEALPVSARLFIPTSVSPPGSILQPIGGFADSVFGWGLGPVALQADPENGSKPITGGGQPSGGGGGEPTVPGGSGGGSGSGGPGGIDGNRAPLPPTLPGTGKPPEGGTTGLPPTGGRPPVGRLPGNPTKGPGSSPGRGLPPVLPEGPVGGGTPSRPGRPFEPDPPPIETSETDQTNQSPEPRTLWLAAIGLALWVLFQWRPLRRDSAGSRDPS